MTDDRKDMRIDVAEDGPYQVSGDVPLAPASIVVNEDGESVDWAEGERLPGAEAYSLCRCGRSKAKPYCDFTHLEGFDGTETAANEPYVQAAACVEGPEVKLLDARRLCAEARFCDRAGGLWNLVTRCDEPGVRDLVEDEAAKCPSGRYTICDPDGKHHEPRLEPSIALVEDPSLGVSGPLWVRGGIPVFSAEGEAYETRNRVTLCRCGSSGNKPFCDGSHIAARFRSDE